MFAGPNGSGKSTLKSVLPVELLGVYLNPDEVEDEMLRQGFLDLQAHGVSAPAEEALRFFEGSEFLKAGGYTPAAGQLGCVEGRLTLGGVAVNSYWASAAVDFLRRKLLEQRAAFTSETVMSHPSKVALLAQAQGLGYRTYLYYIATDDPEINISRVRARVRRGGHAVPEDKIVSRYHRSLALLKEASGIPTGPTSSTIRHPTATARGWPKSPRGGSWN